MRPRHKAAESWLRRVLWKHGSRASMRPRHKAAESIHSAGISKSGTPSFNEAAA